MKKLATLVFAILVLVGCKKKGGTPDPGPGPTEPVGTITLSAPAQNSICITGTVISATQSTVLLQWNAVPNATSYTVTIKDLSTGLTTNVVAIQHETTATFNRNTPYSWWVTAVASVTPKTAVSEVWKFYNAGNGVTSYAPFPADAMVPSRNQAVTTVGGKTTLTWIGSDADNDILNYDVYLGTTNAPPLLKKEIVEQKLENVELTANLTYYWKVITRDKNGNTSASGVISFTVK